MSQVHTYQDIGKGRTAYLTGWTSAFEYIDKKKTDNQIGIRYFVVLPGRKYMETSVLVKDMKPLCSNEEIKATLEVTDFPVEFTNFQAQWYRIKDDFKLKCTADAIQTVPR